MAKPYLCMVNKIIIQGSTLRGSGQREGIFPFTYKVKQTQAQHTYRLECKQVLQVVLL